MKLLKPNFVHNKGIKIFQNSAKTNRAHCCCFYYFLDKPIFSVDIHPKGEKFATGGQGNDSGRVVIWNLAPVLSEKAEMDPKVPKILCQM